MLNFNENKFIDYLKNIKSHNQQLKNTCDTHINNVLIKNVPFKPHEVNGEETFNLRDLNLIYTYMSNYPEKKEIDFNKIKKD